MSNNYNAARIMMGGSGSYSGMTLTALSNNTYIPPTGYLYNRALVNVNDMIDPTVNIFSNGDDGEHGVSFNTQYFQNVGEFNYGRKYRFKMYVPNFKTSNGKLYEFIDMLFSSNYSYNLGYRTPLEDLQYQYTWLNSNVPLFFEVWYTGVDGKYPTTGASAIYRTTPLYRWINTKNIGDHVGNRYLTGYHGQIDDIGNSITATVSGPTYYYHIDSTSGQPIIGVSVSVTTVVDWMSTWFSYGSTIDNDSYSEGIPGQNTWTMNLGGNNSMAIFGDCSLFYASKIKNTSDKLNKDYASFIKDMFYDVYIGLKSGALPNSY